MALFGFHNNISPTFVAGISIILCFFLSFTCFFVVGFCFFIHQSFNEHTRSVDGNRCVFSSSLFFLALGFVCISKILLPLGTRTSNIFNQIELQTKILFFFQLEMVQPIQMEPMHHVTYTPGTDILANPHLGLYILLLEYQKSEMNGIFVSQFICSIIRHCYF